MDADFDFHALLQPQQRGDHEFVGQSLPLDTPAIYGGQLMAQVLSTAARTLPEARPIHYLQTCFLAFGDPAGELEFSVTPSRDGRSTSHRLIQVSQRGRTLMTATASFQTDAQGYDHEVEPPVVEAPDVLALDPENYIDFASQDSGFPFLIVEQPGGTEPESCVWARSRAEVPADPLLQQMLFAFLSDATILQSALRPHALQWEEPGLAVATMNHSIWYHRPIEVNGWLLMHSRSPSTSRGRALSVADIFDASGSLLATVAQEGLLRRQAS